MATTYTPRVPLRAGAVVAVAGAAAGLAIASGVASHVAARWIYLVLVAPVAVGFAVGAPLAGVIRRVHLASPSVSSAIAGAAVVAALVLHLALDYWRDHRDRMADIEEMRELKMDIGYDVDEIEADYREAIDELSLRSFLSRRFGFAGEGARPAAGFGSSLGPGASLTVWGIELTLAGFIAVSFARQQAREPACAECGTWRVHHKLGVAAFGVSRQIARALVDRRLDDAVAALVEPDTPEHVELTLLACPAGHDADAGVLRIVDHRRDRRHRPSARLVGDFDVDAREVAALRAALAGDTA